MNTITKRILQELSLIDKEPQYILDLSKFVQNFIDFKRSFEKVFGKDNVIIGYSFKTNSHPKILRAVKGMNGYAEVVSPEELAKAEVLMHENDRIEYERIIYNGVIHDSIGRFKVAAQGGIVNVDNYSQLSDLSKMARMTKTHIKLGIRIMMKASSRFGVLHGSEEYKRTIEEFVKNPYLKLVGIHCHTYGGRDITSWNIKARKAATIGKELGVEYIDFGSNMYGFMEKKLERQFESITPTPREYANVIYKAMKDVYGNEELPLVIMEPGTPVVADTMAILSNVINVRKVNGRDMITADCSIYDMGFLPMTKVVPMDVISNEISKNEKIDVRNATIYGYTCTEGDILYRNYTGSIRIGDKLVFGNLGAYGRELSNNFIRNRLNTYCLKSKKPLF